MKLQVRIGSNSLNFPKQIYILWQCWWNNLLQHKPCHPGNRMYQQHQPSHHQHSQSQWSAINWPCNTQTSVTSERRILLNLPWMWVQCICTQCKHPSQKMELAPTTDRQTPHGHLPESFKEFIFQPEHIILVLLMFTRKPLASIASFQTLNFTNKPSIVSETMARSSTYNSSQGQPVRNSLDSVSSTMINKRGLRTDPWWTPTFTSNTLFT